MKCSLCTVVAGCVLAMILGTPAARGEGGRITFSGAIAEPTCSSTGAPELASPQPMPDVTVQRVACGGVNTAADAGRSYALAVVSLPAANNNGDLLLNYFTGYVNDAGITNATLVVRTYE